MKLHQARAYQVRPGDVISIETEARRVILNAKVVNRRENVTGWRIGLELETAIGIRTVWVNWDHKLDRECAGTSACVACAGRY